MVGWFSAADGKREEGGWNKISPVKKRRGGFCDFGGCGGGKGERLK